MSLFRTHGVPCILYETFSICMYKPKHQVCVVHFLNKVAMPSNSYLQVFQLGVQYLQSCICTYIVVAFYIKNMRFFVEDIQLSSKALVGSTSPLELIKRRRGTPRPHRTRQLRLFRKREWCYNAAKVKSKLQNKLADTTLQQSIYGTSQEGSFPCSQFETMQKWFAWSLSLLRLSLTLSEISSKVEAVKVIVWVLGKLETSCGRHH